MNVYHWSYLQKKVQHCLLILMLFKVFENIYTL